LKKKFYVVQIIEEMVWGTAMLVDFFSWGFIMGGGVVNVVCYISCLCGQVGGEMWAFCSGGA